MMTSTLVVLRTLEYLWLRLPSAVICSEDAGPTAAAGKVTNEAKTVAQNP